MQIILSSSMYSAKDGGVDVSILHWRQKENSGSLKTESSRKYVDIGKRRSMVLGLVTSLFLLLKKHVKASEKRKMNAEF